jgi:hypothetical protein
VSSLRAVMRRLDPWAALLLGVLLALGVVILLATPGPWQRVVGKDAPVRIEPPAPDDLALFVLGGRDGACSGIVWLHLDPQRSALTAVVIARRVSAFAPGAGFAPVGDIVDSLGPLAAATALGRALHVRMNAWVTLDRQALEQAVQPMFPMNGVRAARTRYRDARASWRGRGGAEKSWATQYETLRAALPQVPFEQLNVVAFSNYVLGFGFVKSDLTLQGATWLADALRQADTGHVAVRAAPVVVERCRGGQVWRVDSGRMELLRQSLALGLTPPETGALVTPRLRAAHVLVVVPFPRGPAAAYAAQVRRSLQRSSGAPVAVTVVSGTDDGLADRAARVLDTRPALAVLVAPATAEPSRRAVAAVASVCAMLRARGQEAVVSGPLPAPSASAIASPARAGLAAVVMAGGSPVSWLPGAPPVVVGAWSAPSGMGFAARANVETLVRVCWPGTLAPRLASTRLRFGFVAAQQTRVGVMATRSGAQEGILEQLRLWGYVGEPLALDGAGWQPPAPGPALYYRGGERTAATALAGDLGLSARSVISSGDAPRDLVLVLAE